MKEGKSTDEEILPKEWTELVKYATNSVVTKQQFIEFLEKKTKKLITVYERDC